MKNISTTKKERLIWADVAKGLCMVAVIFSHVPIRPSGSTPFFQSWFLAGFFFISGFFFLNPDKPTNVLQKYANIITSILIPYISYWFISYAVEQCLKGNYCFVSNWLSDVSGGGKLWFASALFVSEILTLTYLWATRFRRIFIYIYPLLSIAIYFALPVGDYPWYFRASWLANFYIGIGMIARIHQKKVITPLLENRGWAAALLPVFMVFVAIDIVWIHNVGSFNHEFSCYPFFIVESIVSVALLICVANMWRKYNRIILFVGMNSLLYYFFQRQAYLVIDKVLHLIGIAEKSVPLAFVETIGTVFLLIIPIMIVNRWLPFMSGKMRIQVPLRKN